MNSIMVFIIIGRGDSHGISLLSTALTSMRSISSSITLALASFAELETVAVVFERLMDFSTSINSTRLIRSSTSGKHTLISGQLEHAGQASVEFKDVELSYNPGVGPSALKSISFSVPAG